MESREYEIDLKQIFQTICKRWIVITVTTVCMIVIAIILSFFVIKPTYETSTTLIVNYKQDQNSVTTYNDLVMSQKLVETYSEIVKSNTVTDKVINQLNLDMTTEDFISKISVSGIGNTEILKISVKNNDPQMAALIANTVSGIFQQEVNKIMEVDNVSTIDIAKVPEEPISPNKLLNTLISAFLGITGSIAVIFIFEFLNRTYKSPGDVEKYLGLPLIGAIPDMMLENESRR